MSSMKKAMTLGAALAATLCIAPGAFAQSRSAEAGEAKLVKMLEGREAGKPVSCINLRSTGQSTVIDGTAIVYRMGSTLYVNRPRSGAESLDDDDILVSRTISSQLCNLDVITLRDRTAGFQTGFVSLGDFVPYTKPKTVATR
ncbi:hypothetical protein [Sphingomonas rustica]